MQTQRIERITVSLPHEMLAAMKEKVSSGDYASTSELVRDAMRLWQKAEDDRAASLQALKGRLKKSLASGAPVPMDKVFKNLKTRALKNTGRRA